MALLSCRVYGHVCCCEGQCPHGDAAAEIGIIPAFAISINSDAVMGLAMVGMALFGIGLIYLITGQPEMVLGFSFGASMLAPSRKGGRRHRTADIAADLVGKVRSEFRRTTPATPPSSPTTWATTWVM